MTAVYDTLSATVEKLIGNCHESQRGFKAAAEAARAQDLKRLFQLYSNQRTRFAGELQAQYNLPIELTASVERADADFSGKTDFEILQSCIEADQVCLQSYRNALKTGIPGRAQFLIAAQYSLMQQVHARLKTMALKNEPATTAASHVL